MAPWWILVFIPRIFKERGLRLFSLSGFWGMEIKEKADNAKFICRTSLEKASPETLKGIVS